MATLATRWCWSKRRDEPGQSSAWPDDPDDAETELKEDNEEPKQPDEDRSRKMRSDVVVDKVDDVVDDDGDATMEDQGVLRYCLRRRCSRNSRVGGGARVLKTLLPNPCVSGPYACQLIRLRAHVRVSGR
jgi:hypothetical protein